MVRNRKKSREFTGTTGCYEDIGVIIEGTTKVATRHDVVRL